jgi:hypothetical protein
VARFVSRYHPRIVEASTPEALDRGAFRSVAALAEQLEIPFSVATPSGERHDVVELKPILRATLDTSALVATPNGVPHGFGDDLCTQTGLAV